MGCCCCGYPKPPRKLERRRSRTNQMVHYIQEIEEFRNLPAADGKQSMENALRKKNSKMNRYRDVMPYDYNRVILESSPHDYINASYIETPDQDFIATQGPLRNTIADFWDMVWQENSRVIVMLTPLVEDGRHRCAKYWPGEEEKGWQLADYKISYISKTSHAVCEERTFYLELLDGKEEGRVISHFFITRWPDLDVPDSCPPSTFVDFVKFVRKRQEEHFGDSVDPPVIAHCSAGIGRSGVYILVDRLVNAVEAGEDASAVEELWQIRKQRALMVETEKQFAYVLRCYDSC